MKGLRLYKKEKLRSVTAIDALFRRPARSHGVFTVMAYPWKAVWTHNDNRHTDGMQFLITVPKKRLRHAVDRVAMRRKCREAYRLNRAILDNRPRIDIAFIYVADRMTPYAATLSSIVKILTRISNSIALENETKGV